MADSFNITLSIEVTKKGESTPVVKEDNIFNDKSFALMSIHAADFYELISKLRAKK